MGCLSHRQKATEELSDTKWDYINLDDFRARSCGPGFAYFWLWVLLITSILVYAVDTFTAVNLLIFDRWSSNVEPGIPFYVSKWIFSVCIILSFLNLGWEAFRAWKVMKRGNVAECYLDPLAVRWESIRFGSGQGYRRFLVFAELTKTKKGAEYIALFTYFNLHGPRQVVNAFTLKSVYEAKLIKEDANNFESSFTGFFDNIRLLAEDDYQQALILGAMCFTFVIWVFSCIFLLAAVLFFVFFLWGWIPRADGGLRGYCARKVNKALRRIVTEKVNHALAKGQANRLKAERKAAEKNGETLPIDRFAALPTLPNVGPGPMFTGPPKDDDLPQMPTLGRDESVATLPVYSSRPNTPGNIEMNSMNQGNLKLSRVGTKNSVTSNYSSRAPLVGAAADMGYGGPLSPGPNGPDTSYSPAPRTATPGSQMGYGVRHMPSNSGSSFRAPSSDYSRSPPGPRPVEPYNPGYDSRSATPAMYRGQQPSAPLRSPLRSAHGPVPGRGPNYTPQRNMATLVPQGGPGGEGPGRSYTPYNPSAGPPPSQRGNPYNYDVESQFDRRY